MVIRACISTSVLVGIAWLAGLTSADGQETDRTHAEAMVKKSGQAHFYCYGTPSHGHIDVLLDIDQKGKPFNIRLGSRTESDDDSAVAEGLRAARRFRFFPATEDGKPVIQRDYRLSWDLNCTQEDIDRHAAAVAQAARDDRLRQLAGLYLMSCKDPSPNVCMAQAIAYAQSQINGGSAAMANNNPKLMLFGGEGHRVYLGCLNCGDMATDSIFNQFGENGSQFSSTSIWNHFSDFASPFSDESVCNNYASDPPVIVDQSGHFYGRLTIAKFNPQRTQIVQFQQLAERVCASQ